MPTRPAARRLESARLTRQKGEVGQHGAAHVERDRREDQLREAFAVHHFNALAGLLVEDESRTNNADGGGGGGGGGSIVGPEDTAAASSS